MLENLEEFAHECLTSEQRKLFATFLKNVSEYFDNEEDLFYRPFIMSVDILATALSDDDDDKED